jgi:site-specific DNA recombinase
MEQVIIYTRVSTEEQADKGYSLRDQKDRLEKYCILKDYKIINHYEEDFSAKTFERPKFKQLLKFIRDNRKEVDRLLIVKWDRFSRNATDALNMLRTLDKLGVTVDAVEQPIDLSIPENKLMLNFYLTAPEVENDRRAMNTMNGMRRAMKEGRWVNRATIGFKFIYDERNKPILVKNEKAPLIFEAFNSLSHGILNIEEVRRMMAQKGLVCSRNNFWKLVRNPIYCGKILIKAHKDEPEELVNGIHEPIVSEELFYKVQNVLFNKKKINLKPLATSSNLPLRGSLVCPNCGKNLTGSASKGNGGKYYYYHCQSGCSHRVKADVAHDSFCKWLDSFSFKPSIAKLYLAIIEDTFKSNEAARIKEIQLLKNKIKETESSLLKVEKKFINDELERDSYIRLKDSFKFEKINLQENLDQLQNVDSEFMEYISNGINILSNLKNYYISASAELKQKLVGSIFPEKLIYANGEYRTTKESEILRLLCIDSEGFEKITNKKSRKNAGQFALVARRGIEPLYQE